MQFIDHYALRPRKKTITENLHNLNLNQTTQPKKIEEKILDRFNKDSFISLLHRTFKDCSFIDLNEQQEDFQEKEEGNDKISFSLMLDSQYQDLKIVVVSCINIKEENIKYESYLIKNYQMISFPSDQINAISRYLSIYLNPKIGVGFMCIDPDSGKMTYELINNSLGYIQKRIIKAPNQLVAFIDHQIRQIQKKWKNILPHFFNHMSIQMKLSQKQPLPSIKRQTIKDKFTMLNQRYNYILQFIKQSYIEYPFMFDEIVQKDSKQVLKKIRFKFLRAEQKSLKRRYFDKMMHNRQYYSSKFTNTFIQILQSFTNKSNLSTFTMKNEVAKQKIDEISKHLMADNWQGRINIYSQIFIKDIKKNSVLMKSGFSQLNLLYIVGKKIEDSGLGLHHIVAKTTQNSRFINQTQILKIIGNSTSLFITRFFYYKTSPPNPEQPHQLQQLQTNQPILSDQPQINSIDHGQPQVVLNFQNKILLEYCPYKSVDSYLNIHRKIISFETKLFFLFQIAIGIKSLRDFGIIHNDIKPQNVLLKIVGDKNKVNGTFLLRLIDFGQSYFKYQKSDSPLSKHKRGFTIPYAAPEQARNERFSQKIDIFSFGVIIYQIMFDSFPVEALRKGKEIYSKEEDYLKYYSLAPQKCKYYATPKIMLLLYQLCLKCVNPNPIHRPYIDWVILILQQILIYTQKTVN